LVRLEKLGLIVREQHRYGGSTPLFVGLTDRMVAWLPALREWGKAVNSFDPVCGVQEPQVSQKQGAQVAHIQETQVSHIQGAQVPHFWETPLKQEEISKEKKQEANAALASLRASSGKIYSPKNAEGETTMPTIKDVAAAFSTLTPKKIELNADPDKVQGLVAVWRSAMAARGYPAPALSMKMRGQLKHLLGALPKGRAVALVGAVMAEWESFGKTCSVDAGAFNIPAQPEIGFLLKHVALVQGFVQKSENEAKYAFKPAKYEPVQSIAQEVVAAPEPKKHVSATAEEVLAIFNGVSVP
jgi:hypothetical protein